ncbi:MATE family efflux transporter [uncultured Subdoligranulum sp.]|uniref:MATE family efflux transporter n=1 Tax=uncultured Subdoligranulum sp. TaxID=512298 RepID=UPI0025D40D03|nr:MATE family efflux transporter [uncultured Subdoligranulum sp.]
MTTQTLRQDFGRYVSLSVLGMIAVSCYILADTFFVAQGLGTTGLAALNLAIPVYNVIHGTGLLLGMGGATKFSILKSQGAHRRADSVFTHTLGMAAAAAAVFALAGALGAPQLAALLGADGETAAMTGTYLRVLLLFAPAFLCNDVLVCFVRNDGAPQLAMAATLSGSLANVVMDWFFIFPCGMGIFGAVLATGFSPVIGVIVQSPHWLGRRRGFHLRQVRPRLRTAGQVLALGVPSLLDQLSGAVVMITFNTLILGLTGNTGVAAYGVVANLSLVVLSVYTGIAQGIQPLVSRAWGQGQRAALQRLLRYALGTALVFSAALYLVFFLGAGPIAGVFNSEQDPAMQAIACQGLRLYFLAAPFAGVNIILAVYFASVEQAVPAQAVSLLRGILVILPMAVALAAAFGMVGVWVAFPVSEALVALVAWALLRRCRRTLYPASRES